MNTLCLISSFTHVYEQSKHSAMRGAPPPQLTHSCAYRWRVQVPDQVIPGVYAAEMLLQPLFSSPDLPAFCPFRLLEDCIAGARSKADP